MSASSPLFCLASFKLHFHYPKEPAVYRCEPLALSKGQSLSIHAPNGGSLDLITALSGLEEPAQATLQACPPFRRPKASKVACLFETPDSNLLTLSPSFELSLSRGSQAPNQWRAYLEALQLSKLLDTPITHLSSGQRCKLALARLLFQNPEALLLDDPFAFLDPTSRALFTETLQSQVLQGACLILFSAHLEGLFCPKQDPSPQLGAALPHYRLSYHKHHYHLTLPSNDPTGGDEINPSAALAFKLQAPGQVCLSLDKLDIGYPGQAALLEQVSFQLKQGEVLILDGPNGSGKSTLFQTIRGMIRPLGGKLSFPLSPAPKRLWGKRRSLPVRLLHANARAHLWGDQADQMASLTGLPIQAQGKTHPLHLSNSKARLLALGALLQRPADVYLLDEPSVGLSDQELSWLIDKLGTLKGGVIIATHDKRLKQALPTRTLRLQNRALMPDST